MSAMPAAAVTSANAMLRADVRGSGRRGRGARRRPSLPSAPAAAAARVGSPPSAHAGTIGQGTMPADIAATMARISLRMALRERAAEVCPTIPHGQPAAGGLSHAAGGKGPAGPHGPLVDQGSHAPTRRLVGPRRHRTRRPTGRPRQRVRQPSEADRRRRFVPARDIRHRARRRRPGRSRARRGSRSPLRTRPLAAVAGASPAAMAWDTPHCTNDAITASLDATAVAAAASGSPGGAP